MEDAKNFLKAIEIDNATTPDDVIQLAIFTPVT